MSWHARAGRLSAIITILPSSMLGGWVIGHYLIDKFLGSSPWGGIVMILVGAGAGFFEIVRLLVRDQGSEGDGPRDGDG